MLNIKNNKLKILFCLVCFGVILMTIGYIKFGQRPEIFYDIISETLTQTKTNKSFELKWFWMITVIGIIILLALFLFNKKSKKENIKEKIITPLNGLALGLVISNFVYFIFRGQFSFYLIGVLLLLILSKIVLPGKEIKYLVTCCFMQYSIYALLIIINFFGLKLLIPDNLLLLGTVLLGIFLMNIEKKYNILDKAILIFQAIIPTVLVAYLVNRYTYKDQILYLNMPVVAKMFFILLISLLQIYTLYFIYKRIKTKDSSLNNQIAISSIITIFIFNIVPVNTSLIVPIDLHHYGENILSFQQIFSFKQIPYLEYIPVSGLYSVLSGFVLELVGGKFVYYNVANVVFQMIFYIITILLVSKHLNKIQTLLFSLLFFLPDYNRIYLILISILILMLPKLVENKNLWLKVWMYVCFFGGLYYPTYGIAVLVGTLPFGIWQFISYIRSPKFKVDIKKISFYMWWIVLLIPIIFSIPLLINMAKHVLIYSGQTTLADGISVFGQVIPNDIFDIFGTHKIIKSAMYYSIRYVIPACLVWTFVILLLNLFLDDNLSNKKVKIKEIISSNKFLAISSGLLILLVSYSYTLVRADFKVILSRTGYIYCIIGGMLLLFIFIKYLDKSLSNYVIISISIGIIMSLNFSPLSNFSDKYIYSYAVPEKYELIEDSKLPRLGNGFASPDSYGSLVNKSFSIKDMEKLYDNAHELLSYDKDLKFVLYGCLGTYYITDIPTIGQPSIQAIKGLKASNELIDIIKKYKPVVGRNINSTQGNYYVYHWLMTTDEYLYSTKYEAFLPKKLYQKIFSSSKGENKLKANLSKEQFTSTAATFGESFDTLKNIFEEVSVKYNSSCKYSDLDTYECDYSLKTPIEKDTVDFIYLDINTNRDNYFERDISNVLDIDKTNDDIVVTISWGDNQKVECFLYKGKLLMEIGANSDWLLNKHDNFKVSVKGIQSNYQLNIKQIKFLKLDVNRKE